MSKLMHCEGVCFDAREWHKLLCEQEWIGQFKHQVVNIGKCPKCRLEVWGWYGIDHQDRENHRINAIKPRKLQYWKDRVKKYTLVSSKGALAVTAQKYWDGIPLKFIGIQAVQA